jgi:hypothetical protein
VVFQHGGWARCYQLLTVKKYNVTKHFTRSRTLTDTLENIKMDIHAVGKGHELNRSGSGQVQVAGFCECGNEPAVSIKCGEFLD